MKKLIYAISTYNVVIEYPNYLEPVMMFIFKRVKVTVERPKMRGNKIRTIIFDEFAGGINKLEGKKNKI